MNAFKKYAIHYLWGLLATMFNGGITSLVAIIAEFADRKLPNGLTWATCWHTFAISCAAHAVLYFSAHPIPVTLPDGSTQIPFPKVSSS